LDFKSSKVNLHLFRKRRYFQKCANHALRHIGVNYWLSKTDYNFGLIAEIGGWNTIDKLKKSYGQIPSEKILEVNGLTAESRSSIRV